MGQNVAKGRAAKDLRRNEAALRQAARDGITDEQQLDKLIKAGHSHCREAMRLRHRIAHSKADK
jgi:hypothetical protein